jgi:hypothetical protein
MPHDGASAVTQTIVVVNEMGAAGVASDVLAHWCYVEMNPMSFGEFDVILMVQQGLLVYMPGRISH